jgi:hypothetical protein
VQDSWHWQMDVKMSLEDQTHENYWRQLLRWLVDGVPDTVAGMPEDLRYTGRGVTTVEERELWHMPVVLFLLLGLVSAEWGYRRVAGLA